MSPSSAIISYFYSVQNTAHLGFSCCSDEMPNKKPLEEGRLSLLTGRFEGAVHHSWGVRAWEPVVAADINSPAGAQLAPFR